MKRRTLLTGLAALPLLTLPVMAGKSEMILPDCLYFEPTRDGSFKARMDFSDPATPSQVKEMYGTMLTREQIKDRDIMATIYDSAIYHANDAASRGLIPFPH